MEPIAYVKRVRSQATVLARWLFEPRLFWLTTLIVAVAVYLAVRPGATELQVRWISAVLQLIGVGIVAWDIRQTTKQFKQKNLLQWITDWWKRRPTGSKRLMVGSAQMSFEGNAAVGLAASQVYSKTASLEDRVGRLERDAEALRDRITETRADLEQANEEHRKKLNEEARKRAEEDAELRKLVEASQTGGLALSAAGAVLLVVGIVLGTFPEEIAGYFCRFGRE